MTAGMVEFQESAAGRRVEQGPLAHLSIEVGHFYWRDLGNGPDFFRDHFRLIARWVATARDHWIDRVAGKRLKTSICFLIDDYFGQPLEPGALIPRLMVTARESGIEIDYIARESGCADRMLTTDLGALSLADLVVAMLVEDPPPGSPAARPPVQQTGWLCNGQRSPVERQPAAMKAPGTWQPPSENAAVNHSIFTDVELWSERVDGRKWSCAMLAAVWQLMRMSPLQPDVRAGQGWT